MDISKIHAKHIEKLALEYDFLVSTSDTPPISAKPKMQKRMRKYIKGEIKGIKFPKNVMRFINDDVSDSDFFAFLKACYDYVEQNGTREKQEFEKASAGLSQEVKQVLWEDLVSANGDIYCTNPRQFGSEVHICIESSSSYVRTLILMNTNDVSLQEFDYIINCSLSKNEDKYALTLTTQKWDTIISRKQIIEFTDAKILVSCYRAKLAFDTLPWISLQELAHSILLKRSLGEEYLNSKEKELVPLLTELCGFSPYSSYIAGQPNTEYSILKSYFSKYKFNKLTKKIDKLNGIAFGSERYDKCSSKLIFELCFKKYEPLWRELYDLISESQAEYPKCAETLYTKEQLGKIRTNIQNLMEGYGYSGTYPDFIKIGDVRSIHLAESHGMSYFVAFEKNVAFHIHCNEQCFDNDLNIQFVSGTQLLRKNETPTDYLSCIFNARGRCYSSTVNCAIPASPNKEIGEKLRKTATIAVKRAELKKLTKQERNEIFSYDTPFWQLFLIYFMLFGGFFAILFTPAMMIFFAVMLWIDGMLSEFFSLPWWLMFVLGWILSGGAMGLITALAKKK